jgi:hypothetical protein
VNTASAVFFFIWCTLKRTLRFNEASIFMKKLTIGLGGQVGH